MFQNAACRFELHDESLEEPPQVLDGMIPPRVILDSWNQRPAGLSIHALAPQKSRNLLLWKNCLACGQAPKKRLFKLPAQHRITGAILELCFG